MLIAWALGFISYQLINPGFVHWWASAWQRVDRWLGFTPQSWMSASILSFLVFTIGFIMVLQTLGLDIAPVLTGAGIAGVSVMVSIVRSLLT